VHRAAPRCAALGRDRGNSLPIAVLLGRPSGLWRGHDDRTSARYRGAPASGIQRVAADEDGSGPGPPASACCSPRCAASVTPGRRAPPAH